MYVTAAIHAVASAFYVPDCDEENGCGLCCLSREPCTVDEQKYGGESRDDTKDGNRGGVGGKSGDNELSRGKSWNDKGNGEGKSGGFKGKNEGFVSGGKGGHLNEAKNGGLGLAVGEKGGRNDSSRRKTSEKEDTGSKLCLGQECKEECYWEMKQNPDLDIVALGDIDQEEMSGEAVSAHRDVLRAANSVWDAMLGGNWQESGERAVRVRGMDAPTLRAIVHHMYGCKCAALTKLNLQTYVSLVLACDMYGMPQLQTYALSRIKPLCCTADNLIAVYGSGIGRVDDSVVIECLWRVVVEVSAPTWLRSQWLYAVSTSPFAADLLYNLREMLLKPMQKTLYCNCDPKSRLIEEYAKLK